MGELLAKENNEGDNLDLPMLMANMHADQDYGIQFALKAPTVVVLLTSPHVDFRSIAPTRHGVANPRT